MAGESVMRRAKVSLPHKGTMKNLYCCGRYMKKEKKLGLCRVNENFAIIVENLSPRERTDDTAILNYLTKGYPRTRMKVWYVKVANAGHKW